MSCYDFLIISFKLILNLLSNLRGITILNFNLVQSEVPERETNISLFFIYLNIIHKTPFNK